MRSIRYCDKVEDCATKNKLRFSGLYKHGDSDESKYKSRVPGNFIRSTDDNAGFDGGNYDLAGGSAWLLTREELDGAFDYLFIDEAGQVALADTLALSTCAKEYRAARRSVAARPGESRAPAPARRRLGAPAPARRGSNRSAASWYLLDVSYRMGAGDMRLRLRRTVRAATRKLAPQTTMHAVRLPNSELQGLFYAPLEHAGNSSSSPEEADEVVRSICCCGRMARLLTH